MGRAAWGRRPPLTRERRNQPSRPGRTGRPLVAKRPQTPAGESGERAGPADGGRDGLGAGPAAIPAVGGKVDYPAEKRPLRAAQRVGVFAVDRENGGFGPIRPDPVRNRTSTSRWPPCPSASTSSDLHPHHRLHQGRRAGGGGGRA